MTRSQTTHSAPISCSRQNCCAVLIAVAAVSVLYFNFEPTPAAADLDQATIDLAELTASAVAPTAPTRSSATNNRRASHGPSQSQGRGRPSTAILQGKRALLMQLLLLQRGCQKLSAIPDYTATFVKRERIDGVLGENQVILLKVRREPFSVYMKWLKGGDKDRELLYVAGQHNGKMLVRVGGFKGRVLPALKLDPNGSLAMKESRHPVTKIGLLGLACEVIAYRQNDLKGEACNCCQMLADQRINGQDCYCFLVEYDSKKVSEIYRKSLIYIDKENSLPVLVKNYTWPVDADEQLSGTELDEATFIEHYAYSNIQLNPQLAANEFDRTNRKYRFTRR